MAIPLCGWCCFNLYIGGTMQKYNNMPKEQNIGKKIVLEFLDFLRFKIENDELTMEETESLARTMEINLQLMGTTDDFARFYGKSKTNVTTVIDRKMMPRPKRTLLHSFNLFRKNKPSTW